MSKLVRNLNPKCSMSAPERLELCALIQVNKNNCRISWLLHNGQRGVDRKSLLKTENGPLQMEVGAE